MARRNLISELFGFLKENKKWWMLPILLIFGILSALLILAASSPAVTPFIYTLF